MSDQKRLLMAAVLMAAVLFISWQFMGKSATSGSSQNAPQVNEFVQQEEIPIPDDSVLVDKQSTEIASNKANNVDIEEILPEERVIKVIVYEGDIVIVEADISTFGGTVIGWKLPQYEDMPGTGSFDSINFNGNSWITNSSYFETLSEDTILVNEIPQTLVFIDPSGEGKITYTFTPGKYGFLYETEGLAETTVLNAGILPVSELNSIFSPKSSFSSRKSVIVF